MSKNWKTKLIHSDAKIDFHATRGRPDYGHRIVRLNIGIEDVNDLRDDLGRALDGLAS